jgi:hypothetical protein
VGTVLSQVLAKCNGRFSAISFFRSKEGEEEYEELEEEEEKKKKLWKHAVHRH